MIAQLRVGGEPKQVVAGVSILAVRTLMATSSRY